MSIKIIYKIFILFNKNTTYVNFIKLFKQIDEFLFEIYLFIWNINKVNLSDYN